MFALNLIFLSISKYSHNVSKKISKYSQKDVNWFWTWILSCREKKKPYLLIDFSNYLKINVWESLSSLFPFFFLHVLMLLSNDILIDFILLTLDSCGLDLIFLKYIKPKLYLIDFSYMLSPLTLWCFSVMTLWLIWLWFNPQELSFGFL